MYVRYDDDDAEIDGALREVVAAFKEGLDRILKPTMDTPPSVREGLLRYTLSQMIRLYFDLDLGPFCLDRVVARLRATFHEWLLTGEEPEQIGPI